MPEDTYIKWNNWRDRLKDASFRDVPFKILSATSEGGRRSVLHQYPFDDVPYWEDMGKEANTYQMQAYIVANLGNNFDHFKERDAFIKALEEAGAGTLVHPFLGTKQVGLQGKYKLDESFADGGVARFTITFVNAGRAAQPGTDVTSTGDVEDACTYADSQVVVIKDPSLLDKALAAYEAVQGAIAIIDGVYSTCLQIQSEVVGAISAVQTALARIRGTIDKLIGFPDQFTAAITETLATYQNLIPGMKAGDTSLVTASLSMATSFQGITEAVPNTTPERLAQIEIRYWATEAGMAGALSQAIRAAVQVEYTSYDQAKSILDQLITALDWVLDYIGSHSKNDALAQSLEALRPLITNVLLEKGAALPPLKDVMLPGDPQPALALAQKFYGDVVRDQEIIDMNPIMLRHPGFPQAGGTIRVLSE